MKIRLEYAKKAQAKYIAHLDLTRVFHRALRRAAIPVAYSQGFNPHPKIAFGAPLPVGIEGEHEYVDISLQLDLATDALAVSFERLRTQMPLGIDLLAWAILPSGAPKLMAMLDTAIYEAWVPLEAGWTEEALAVACGRWLKRSEVWIERRKGEKVTQVNIRPFVRSIDLSLTPHELDTAQPGDESGARGSPTAYLLLDIALGNSGSVRVTELLQALCRDEQLPFAWRQAEIRRREVYKKS